MNNELSAAIETYCNAGFYSREEVADIICHDLFSDDKPDRDQVLAAVENVFDRNIWVQLNWPVQTENEIIDRIFRAFYKTAIIGLQNRIDYKTAIDEVTDIEQNSEYKLIGFKGFCFYTRQDMEIAINGGGLRFSFGSIKNDKVEGVKIGSSIFDILKKNKFDVEWNGTADKKIAIPNFRWRRRYQKLQEFKIPKHLRVNG